MPEPGEGRRAKAETAADIIIWKKAIEKELRTAAEWEGQWGFMKAPARLPRRQKPSGQLSGSASSPQLNSAGKSMVSPAKAQTVASWGGLSQYDPDLMANDRFRVMTSMSQQVPRERYSRPITTQQEIGWRTTLERFGASQHGVKRDPDLWAEA
eukprot:TRINITY_DN126588_c0_g1_i1.p1 TRINITY_DN126588_c0_g1~~TRINITY_DN126588_c0_g1_i1.p1  ORF type:complete len:178 (+),score=28.64 TRINITY_DN126588_c0_g1_i1:73-534(+)